MTSALQAVIFDFDGVIADSEPLHLRAFQKTFREEGIELDRREYYARYLGYDDVGMVQAVADDRGIAMGQSAIASLLARKASVLQDLLQGDQVLFPGAADFIRATAAEVPVAIASGALKHEIVHVLERAGLRELFPVIVASGDTPQSKPSPAPYVLAFEELRQTSGRDLEARRCVAIEDSRWGLESARGAGLRCVGVTTSYRAEELQGAELVVGGLTDLTVSALDSLCAR